MRSSSLAVLLGALLASGCARRDFADCAIACGTDGSCPRALHCSHGFCTSSLECEQAQGSHQGHDSAANAGTGASGAAGSSSIPRTGSGGERAEGGASGGSSDTISSDGGTQAPSPSAAGRAASSGGVSGIAGRSANAGDASGVDERQGGAGGADEREAGAGGADEPEAGAGGSDEPEAGAGGSKADPTGSAGGRSSVDLAPANPELSPPVWSFPHFTGLVTHTIPRLLHTGLDSFSLIVRDHNNVIVIVDCELNENQLVIGQAITLDAGFFSDDPVVAASDSEHALLLARGHDELLYRRGWRAGTWERGWTGDSSVKETPAAVVTSMGQILVVGRGLDGRFRYRAAPFTVEGSSWENGWVTLDFEPSTRPAAAVLGRDRVLIAASTSDGSFVASEWAPGSEQALFWSRLDGVRFLSPPVMISRPPSTVDLFGRGADGYLYWQSFVGDERRPWVRISDDFFETSNPAVVADGEHGFFVFTKDEAGNLWSRRYGIEGWTRWAIVATGLSLAHDEDFPGAALALAEGRVVVVARNRHAHLHAWIFTP